MSALAARHGAVNLGQGFPDFDCDPALIEAVSRAMRAGHNQYPPMPGWPALRQAVARKIADLRLLADELSVAGAGAARLFRLVGLSVKPLSTPCNLYLPKR